jgi:hypothetical protein
MNTTIDYFILGGALGPTDLYILHRRLHAATSLSY